MTRASVLLVFSAIIGAGACDRFLQFTKVSKAPPDAAPDAPEPPSDLCASDDFEGSSIDLVLWTPYMDPGAMIAEMNGQLVMTLSSGSAHSYAGVGMLSRSMVGLTSSVEVVRVPTAATGTSTELKWTGGTGSNTSSYILFRDGSDLAVALYLGSNAPTYPVQTPYDPTAARYWRIRHDGSADVLYFEAGSDGSHWHAIYSEAPAFSLASAHPVLNCGTYNAVPSPGDCAYDNFLLTGCVQ